MYTVKINNKDIPLLTLQDYLKLSQGDAINYVEIIDKYLQLDLSTSKSQAEFQLLHLLAHSLNSEPNNIPYVTENNETVTVNLNMIQILEQKECVVTQDNVRVVFVEPTLAVNNFDNPVDIIISCIDKIYIDSEVFTLEDLESEELAIIYKIITAEEFDKIIDVLTNRLVLYIEHSEGIETVLGFENIMEIIS